MIRELARIGLLLILEYRLRRVRAAREQYDRRLAELEAFVVWWPSRYRGSLRKPQSAQ